MYGDNCDKANAGPMLSVSIGFVKSLIHSWNATVDHLQSKTEILNIWTQCLVNQLKFIWFSYTQCGPFPSSQLHFHRGGGNSESSILLEDDFDINVIPLIQIGLLKFNENHPLSNASKVWSSVKTSLVRISRTLDSSVSTNWWLAIASKVI